MTVHCVASSCRKQIEDSWPFCPYCGTDNRPPANQHDVPVHTHEYLHKVGFCIYCGESYDELPGYTGRSRINTAATFFFLAIVFGLCIANIQLAHGNRPALGSEWIRSWYDNEWGRRYRSRSAGTQVCWYLGIGAIFCLVSSITIFFKLRDRNGNAYWNYDDDKPWWNRRSWW